MMSGELEGGRPGGGFALDGNLWTTVSRTLPSRRTPEYILIPDQDSCSSLLSDAPGEPYSLSLDPPLSCPSPDVEAGEPDGVHPRGKATFRTVLDAADPAWISRSVPRLALRDRVSRAPHTAPPPVDLLQALTGQRWPIPGHGGPGSPTAGERECGSLPIKRNAGSVPTTPSSTHHRSAASLTPERLPGGRGGTGGGAGSPPHGTHQGRLPWVIRGGERGAGARPAPDHGLVSAPESPLFVPETDDPRFHEGLEFHFQLSGLDVPTLGGVGVSGGGVSAVATGAGCTRHGSTESSSSLDSGVMSGTDQLSAEGGSGSRSPVCMDTRPGSSAGPAPITGPVPVPRGGRSPHPQAGTHILTQQQQQQPKMEDFAAEVLDFVHDMMEHSAGGEAGGGAGGGGCMDSLLRCLGSAGGPTTYSIPITTTTTPTPTTLSGGEGGLAPKLLSTPDRMRLPSVNLCTDKIPANTSTPTSTPPLQFLQHHHGGKTPRYNGTTIYPDEKASTAEKQGTAHAPIMHSCPDMSGETASLPEGDEDSDGSPHSWPFMGWGSAGRSGGDPGSKAARRASPSHSPDGNRLQDSSCSVVERKEARQMKSDRGQVMRRCQICDDSASGFHYGVWSCEGCKAFFKRSLQGPIDYVCPATNNCTIDKHRRKSCQACRLRKCLEMGMSRGSKELEHMKEYSVDDCREKKGYRSAMNTSKRKFTAMMDDTDHVASRETKRNKELTNGKTIKEEAASIARDSPQPPSALDPPRRELPCGSDSSGSPGGEGGGIDGGVGFGGGGGGGGIDRPPMHAMVELLLQIEPPVRFAHHDSSQQETKFGLLNSMIRLLNTELVDIVHWAKCIPGYVELGIADRMRLLEASWMEILLVGLLWKSLPHPGIVAFAPDLLMTGEQCQVADMWKGLGRVLGCVDALRGLQVTREELVLLRVTVLFNAELRCQSSQGALREIRERLSEALHYTVLVRLGREPSHLTQLLMLLPHIRQGAMLVLSHLYDLKQQNAIPIDHLMQEMLEGQPPRLSPPVGAAEGNSPDLRDTSPPNSSTQEDEVNRLLRDAGFPEVGQSTAYPGSHSNSTSQSPFAAASNDSRSPAAAHFGHPPPRLSEHEHSMFAISSPGAMDDFGLTHFNCNPQQNDAAAMSPVSGLNQGPLDSVIETNESLTVSHRNTMTTDMMSLHGDFNSDTLDLTTPNLPSLLSMPDPFLL